MKNRVKTILKILMKILYYLLYGFLGLCFMFGLFFISALLFPETAPISLNDLTITKEELLITRGPLIKMFVTSSAMIGFTMYLFKEGADKIEKIRSFARGMLDKGKYHS